MILKFSFKWVKTVALLLFPARHSTSTLLVEVLLLRIDTVYLIDTLFLSEKLYTPGEIDDDEVNSICEHGKG